MKQCHLTAVTSTLSLQRVIGIRSSHLGVMTKDMESLSRVQSDILHRIGRCVQK